MRSCVRDTPDYVAQLSAGDDVNPTLEEGSKLMTFIEHFLKSCHAPGHGLYAFR